MKIFLSWSGSRSKRVAEILRELLRFVFHDDPWMSSEDIGKGKRWSPEIAKALQSANAGVICLTKENLNRPWLLFEAGALSKTIKDSLVCTFLLDVEQVDIGNDNPLSQFQATKNSKEDVFNLLTTINEAYGEEKLDDEILKPSFEKWWLDFETKISSIPPSPKKDSDFPVRKESEILAEILETVRNMERVFGTKGIWLTESDASGNTPVWVRSKIVHTNPPGDDVSTQQESQSRRKIIIKRIPIKK